MMNVKQHSNGTWTAVVTNTRLKGGGWLYVPQELESAVREALPFMSAQHEDGEVIAVQKTEPPTVVPTVPEVDTDALLQMTVDQELRLSMLELMMGGGDLLAL